MLTPAPASSGSAYLADILLAVGDALLGAGVGCTSPQAALPGTQGDGVDPGEAGDLADGIDPSSGWAAACDSSDSERESMVRR